VIHLGPNDLNILKSTGTAIGFCPTSQVIFEKLAPIESFLEKQLPILLGTDDAASNDLADMHAETKIAALISRHQGAATEGLAQRFFESATLATPRFFGIPSGLIEENYLADLLFYPMTIENSPRSHVFESFVFSMNANQLAASMIDGVWRLWNKKPLIEDTEELSHNYDKALRYLNNKIKTQKA
jgi:cytosine/adenosine deaminase-related metal-dependent hydrolase